MPANLIIETSSAELVSEDGSAKFTARLGYDLNAMSLQPRLCVNFYQNGVLVGRTNRYFMAGNRVASDLPGVSDQYFIVDENGKITNG